MISRKTDTIDAICQKIFLHWEENSKEALRDAILNGEPIDSTLHRKSIESSIALLVPRDPVFVAEILADRPELLSETPIDISQSFTDQLCHLLRSVVKQQLADTTLLPLNDKHMLSFASHVLRSAFEKKLLSLITNHTNAKNVELPLSKVAISAARKEDDLYFGPIRMTVVVKGSYNNFEGYKLLQNQHLIEELLDVASIVQND